MEVEVEAEAEVEVEESALVANPRLCCGGGGLCFRLALPRTRSDAGTRSYAAPLPRPLPFAPARALPLSPAAEAEAEVEVEVEVEVEAEAGSVGDAALVMGFAAVRRSPSWTGTSEARTAAPLTRSLRSARAAAAAMSGAGEGAGRASHLRSCAADGAGVLIKSSSVRPKRRRGCW
jgi:hypothetical protein